MLHFIYSKCDDILSIELKDKIDAILEIKNNLKSILFIIINCILSLWIHQRKDFLYTFQKN
jgi:hypothetical protein